MFDLVLKSVCSFASENGPPGAGGSGAGLHDDSSTGVGHGG